MKNGEIGSDKLAGKNEHKRINFKIGCDGGKGMNRPKRVEKSDKQQQMEKRGDGEKGSKGMGGGRNIEWKGESVRRAEKGEIA